MSLPVHDRQPTLLRRVKRSPFSPTDETPFDDFERISPFSSMETSESRPEPDNVDRILSIFGGTLYGPRYPRPPPHKWRPVHHPRPHLGFKHHRPHPHIHPHKHMHIFKPNSGPPKHHEPIHVHHDPHPGSLEEFHHHHFDEIHDHAQNDHHAPDDHHDSFNTIHDHPEKGHDFKPSPHDEHKEPPHHHEDIHMDYHDDHHQFEQKPLHDLHSFDEKPIAFGHMAHEFGHDPVGFSLDHGGHAEYIPDHQEAHGFSDFGHGHVTHEFLLDEDHDPHNIISHDPEPPKLSHHPGYIKGITKNSIYRDDVPFKEVTNENDKIHPGLVPGGVKGLNPELISFISDKTRPYVYGFA